MTKTTSEFRCGWCRRKMESQAGVGRPRAYCRQSCRQRAYESRQQASQLGVSESQLIVTRAELEKLLDQVYVLQAAVEDVDRDLAAGDNETDVKRSLEWVLSAARPLVDTPLL